MKIILPSLSLSIIRLSTVSLLFFFSSLSNAQPDGEKLIEEARCYACHQMSETLLAPPYMAIAERHNARKSIMTDVLARKIVRGGGGNWGLVPMVPNQWVSIEEARIMASWILELTNEQ